MVRWASACWKVSSWMVRSAGTSCPLSGPGTTTFLNIARHFQIIDAGLFVEFKFSTLGQRGVVGRAKY